MAFPIRNQLDDRSAQDIVDWAKRDLIPRFCPEWTDHNVSDPGIALIEVFAAMSEMVLYRVNQIPDRLQLRLMELMGFCRKGPEAAKAPLTFYFSTALEPETALTLDAGIEVATQRSASNPEIVFSTDEPLHIDAPQIIALITQPARTNDNSRWQQHSLRAGKFTIFPDKPETGDALCIGLAHDHSHHVLHVAVTCERPAAPSELDSDNPPLVWQAWCQSEHTSSWVDLQHEADTTGGFTRTGKVRLYLPPRMVKRSLTQSSGEAYWLRCCITEQTLRSRYGSSPEIVGIQVEAWGGTVAATHATSVQNELLGTSDGTPGQIVQLRHTPILERAHDQEYLVVESDSPDARWQEVPDFSESYPEDRHYVLDPIEGTITLGPTLLQPDGQLKSYGAIPPRGSRLRFSRYRYGGGSQGNVAANELQILKQPRAYIQDVRNRTPAVGGSNAESIADAALRAPAYLRTRTRAVTADDYEFLACELSSVARAFCHAPDSTSLASSDKSQHGPLPGEVKLYLLPHIEDIANARYISPEEFATPVHFYEQVKQKIEHLRPAGIRVSYDPPELFWVAVELDLHLPGHLAQDHKESAVQAIEQALYTYLNPFIGGPQIFKPESSKRTRKVHGMGWPFGRSLHLAELYGVIQPLLAEGYIDVLRAYHIPDPDQQDQRNIITKQANLSPGGLICSYQHTINLV
jgi:predicted phage baseplate assembly protein